MRFSIFGLGLALALLGSTAPRLPQTPGSGILISQCDPRPYNNTAESGFRVTPYKSGQRTILAMAYQNEAPSRATAVVFGVVSGSKLAGVGQDSGSFSRGALITHELMLSQEIPPGEQTHCVVLRVLYANGSAWFNPTAPTF
jgi:hypothetical protein